MNYDGIIISTPFTAIGDVVSITALPENIARLTGLKVYYQDVRLWAFRHNPFITFLNEETSGNFLKWTVIQDSRLEEHVTNYIKKKNTTIARSQTEFMLSQIGIQKCVLRHPRLYIYETQDLEPNKIVIHTTGSDRTKAGEPAIRSWFGEDNLRVMSEKLMTQIRTNYRNWNIIQVGAESDVKFQDADKDLRGQISLWEVAREIANATKFIGVNSGLMHIANCFPRVEKRIILTEFSASFLSGNYRRGEAVVGELRNAMMSWLDSSNLYFNMSQDDIGQTFSYLKI